MASLARTQVFPALLLLLNVGSVISACPDGMAKPNFTSGEIVEILFAQAPLFSTIPAVGQDMRHVNLFHSSVVLAQGADASRRYWTLEFGFESDNPLSTMAPQIVTNASAPGGKSLHWHNEAKYCLTYGLLHGREHWTQHLDIVMSVSVDNANRVFDEFVAPLNASTRGDRPQYHNFKVAHAGFFGKVERTFIEDLTCNHGVVWFMHYLSTLGNAVAPDFEFKGTVAVVNAWGVKKVDEGDRDWKHVLSYYGKLNEVAYSNKSSVHKLVDLAELAVERRYAYDPNSGQYSELIGNFFPWFVFQYNTIPLSGPPWMEVAKSSTMIV